MQPYILGIDIGTGSTKAVAVNFTGQVIYAVQQHYPTLHPQPHYSEQNPETIWQAFLYCVQNVVHQTQTSPTAICLSSAMHSLIPVSAGGDALADMMVWNDTRSADIAERLMASATGKSIYENTGTPIHSMLPLCKITWIKENNPNLFQQTHKFISIKEYIWYKLFHEFEIDYSLASATGLFDIKQFTWNIEALSVAGINAERLSQPVATDYKRSNLKEEIASILTINRNMPFVIGASDGCLANLGSFAIEKGIAALTIGSSGAVRIAHAQPIFHYDTMLFSYYLDANTFICGGPTNNGGNAVEWLLKNFLQIPSPNPNDYTALFDRISQVPNGSDGLLFLPYLNGERAPIWDAKSCGVFFGIKPHHTQDFFLRAVLEGICYALSDVLDIVEQLSEAIEQINVSGGFIHSGLWMQLLADITGKKLCLVQTQDASAAGAAYFALKQLDIVHTYSSLTEETPVYIMPDKNNHAIHQKNRRLFKSLYPALKKAMHQAHDDAML